ncbi:MAG: nitrous oxide reductase accessory protein NosL [Taibaiella sp.]|nr:nitrous oxide reductase accessory protein NosL [Taibaiella sp.]
MTRVIVAICGICLIGVLFVPMWRIELNAPQYPEGLSLAIHANGIKGDVAIINGLNHYIGMKTLHSEDFIEFTVLPYIVTLFALLFFAVALLNKRKMLNAAFFSFVAFGVIAMVDFWKWEYDYGHNLDPHAAIVVPGMAYQPPLIGFKQLLNFGAYSIPDIGGWLFIACGAALLFCFVLELKNVYRLRTLNGQLLLLLLPALLLTSCSPAPIPIKIGVDNCDYCRMTISDPRFGAELLISTGKAYKFDDIVCLNAFSKSLDKDKVKNATAYFTDFSGSHSLVEAKSSLLLKSKELKCPMNGHLAAFSNQDSLDFAMATFHGEQTSWEKIY